MTFAHFFCASQEAEVNTKLVERLETAEAAASLLRVELSDTRETLNSVEDDLLQAKNISAESEVA